VIDEFEFTTNEVAGVDPKSTPVAPANELPVIVTDVPPVGTPALGETELTDGPGVKYVYLSAVMAVVAPPGVVTRTSPTPELADALVVQTNFVPSGVTESTAQGLD
jgi:hypothetical protein